MRKNNSKLNFTKNRGASWFSRGRLKISKCSISLARLGECSKRKVTPLNIIYWSLLHLCVRGTCVDDVFVSSYALMAKHVTWLNIEIFCFTLLRHIEGDPFQSLGFSSMNLPYTAAFDLVACRSKTLPNTCSWCKPIVIFSPWCPNRPARHK